MFQIASQIDLEPSATLGMNERVRDLWAAGETVYHFGFGESRFPVHPKMQAALVANAHRKSYLPVQGLLALREAVAAYHGEKLGLEVSANNVIITPGGKAIVFAIQMALGADLLLPTPSWVSYAPQAQLLGQRVHQIPASAEEEFDLTIDALAATVRQVGKRQKLLIINSPNNPTGRMFSAEFLRSLATYCRQNNIFVISDELYGLVPHGSQAHFSHSQFYPEGTAVVGGLSKHLSLGGWRLGHGILPGAQPNLMKAVIKIASETWSCAAAPVQYAAVTAYSGAADLEEYVAECAAIHAARTRYLWRSFQELGIRCAEPQGGFYLFPNFNRWRKPLARKGVTTSPELAAYLLEHHRIATLPASVFGAKSSELSLRVATSYIDMEGDAAVHEILTNWLAHHDADQLMRLHSQLAAAIFQFQAFISSLH